MSERPYAIRALRPEDAARYHPLRVRAVAEHPEAFLVSVDEERQTPIAEVQARIGAQLADGTGLVLGAFRGEALVGFVGLVRHTSAKIRHRAFVWGTYVAPEHRRRGLGRALMEGLLDAARAMRGVARVELSVLSDARAALDLYESLGFEAWGVEPDAVRVGDARYLEVHMSLDLRRWGGTPPPE
jgi:ribosomal protein S18 acetylase RimI-like enzyme